MKTQTQLLSYKDMAARCSLSVPWFRAQRHKRKHGKEHVFDVDPIMIASMPRYRLEDFEDWLERLAA